MFEVKKLVSSWMVILSWATMTLGFMMSCAIKFFISKLLANRGALSIE
jgi:hypothetical protein